MHGGLEKDGGERGVQVLSTHVQLMRLAGDLTPFFLEVNLWEYS
jgi:hypothetical protein